MVTNRIGPPVQGSDFFDRDAERRRAWDFLHRDHLLLLAPRRVGKTSLMLRLKEEAPGKGFAVAYADVAKAPDEVAFVRELLKAVAEARGGDSVFRQLADGPLGKRVRRIRKIGSIELDALTEETWTEVGENLARVLDRQDGRWLVMVDELPVFVLSVVKEDPEGRRARRFLAWFRSLRQRGDRHGSLRWLLAGSIGLDTVAARLNAGDTINDLHLFHLGAFSEPTAHRLLQELAAAHELDLSENARRQMVARVGWLIPFHLQLLFGQLRERCGDRGEPATPEAVDEAFEDLLRPVHKGYFDYWRQRLHEELGRPDGDHAVALLNAVAGDDRGASRSTLSQVLAEQIQDADQRAEKLRYLLDVLEGDGYLVADAGRYRFQSPLLRAYWQRRVAP